MRKAAHAPFRAPSRTNVRFAITCVVQSVNEKPKAPLLIHNITVRVLKIPRASNPIDARSFRPNSSFAKFRKNYQRANGVRFNSADNFRRIFLGKYGKQYMNVVRPDIERGNDPISFFTFRYYRIAHGGPNRFVVKRYLRFLHEATME